MRCQKLILALLLGIGVAGMAGAQTFPTKSIRIVVPYAAGGFTDIVARLVAQKMTERLGQAVIVDNKAGASTIIGGEAVAKAPPDGYTLLMAATTTLSTNPLLFKKLPYQLADFAPIALCGLTPFVMIAHPSLPANNAKELVALAKAKPGSLSVATLGIGSSVHLVVAMFRAATGVDITDIPYKGSGPASNDLLAGQVQLYIDAVSTSVPRIRAGQVKGLGITSAVRSPAAPALPTFTEQGIPDMVAYSWYGLLAPAGTPKPIIDRLNQVANEGLRTAEVRERLTADGGVADIMTPEEFGNLIKEHMEVWRKIIAPLKIQLD